MYSTSEFNDEKGILGVITLPNVIKHWNLHKQFDLNPNLMQNNENKDMYSNWKLQNRNKLKEEIIVDSKYTELRHLASIMNNINKELNQYCTVPNPDDIPDTLGFIEAGNYIANYLVLLTNNILFKIGKKIDEYANGIEEVFL